MMKYIIIPVCVLAVLLALWLFLIAPRGGAKKRFSAFLGQIYAHRGDFDNYRVPENSLAAFRSAVKRGVGIELDLHLTKDGEVIVFHDNTLTRMCGDPRMPEEMTAAEIAGMRLLDTEEKIPTLKEVLAAVDGKVPMIVELKPVNGNHNALSEKTCEMLENYKGLYCLESFDPRCIRWLKKHRPRLVRGQLAHNSLHEKSEEVPFYFRFAMTNLFSNFWNVPDFIAYKFDDRNRFNLRLIRKIWHVQCVAWTLRSKEDYDTAVKEDWIPIFEGFEPNQKTPE